MAFWLTASGLTVIVAGFLIFTLYRARGGAVPTAAYDLQVYRDQLKEVDRDQARGLLAADDAERARLEISRRILDADQALRDAGETGARPAGPAGLVSLLTALGLIGGTIALYLLLGAPGERDLPLGPRFAEMDAARENRAGQAAAEADIPEVQRLPEGADESYLQLVQQLRGTVAERPFDPEGNALLVRHETALGRYRAAYAAKERLIQAQGNAASAQDYAELAELMILAVDGYISPETEEVLKASLGRDPRNPTARYYSGLMFAQAGRYDRTFELWRGLLMESPPDAPWAVRIRPEIARIAQLAGRRFDPASIPSPTRGPDAGDVEAAAGMTASERGEMIRGMIAGLADRLATEGGPAADWAQLIRAYGVLGETDKAAAIAAEATQVFADDEAALAEIRAAIDATGAAE